MCRQEADATAGELQRVQAAADRSQQECVALKAGSARAEADLRELESLLTSSERVRIR